MFSSFLGAKRNVMGGLTFIMGFCLLTDIAKSEPEDSESPTLVAPSPSTIEKLKLPDALGVRPNFTETLGMLSNFDSDVPSNILKDDPDDLSNAPLDLEAIIEEPLTMKDETDGVKIADDAPTPMPTVSSEAKKIKTTSTKVITVSSGQKNKKDSSQTAPAVNPTIRNIRTETVPHSVLIKHAPVESDSDSYDGFSDSEDSDEDLPWSNSLSIPTQSDPLNSSSAIDINTILASANNASSILSAAMNTTSTTLSQDDLAEKIQKRIQKATCINCSAMFLDPRDLKKHILTHKKTLYACELCSEKFPTVFLLKKHSRIHQPSGGSVGLNSQASNHENDRKSKRKREDDDPDWE